MAEDTYNKCCHVFYYDDETEEYKLANPYINYEKLYRYDDDLEQFIEIEKPDQWYYKALAATKKDDNINHPKHYTGCGIECIEAMQLMFTPQTVCGFCVCNAIKYLWRYKDKNGIEDIDKAWWYLNKATEINKNAGGTAFDNNMLFRVNKLYETVLARAEREENK